MERDWTWIYILTPVKGSIREVWLKVGRQVEQFGIRLGRWQYYVAAVGDEDIELEGDEVTWEAIFDWQEKHWDGRMFGALNLTYEDEDWFDAELVLLREPRFGQDEGILKGRSEVEWWSISVGFHEVTMKLRGYEFCDRMMALGKELFIQFDGVFVVAGHEISVVGMPDYNSELYPHYYASVEFLKLLKEGVLREIPERKHPYRSPIWFYLLNKEMYEASKEYIAKLPFKRVEELSNGGVLLFVDYPYTFEFFDKPRIHYID
jgi:hypothetical protein